ncbi:MAG: hypothetical protein Q7T53_06510 [Deltaproteobacteria bacterium]|nr:hypothetical protein [Deltaproteobacteria bacterium]
MNKTLRLMVLAVFAVCCPLLTPSRGVALDLHGFLQGNYSARITGDGPPKENGTDYLLSEERFQLKVSETSKDGSASFFLKTDFFHDGVDEESDVEVREGYIDYTKGRIDLRLGRQIITWGTGDLLFINDVFPKDYEAFYSGRPLEYLKAPVDGLKVGISSDIASLEIVAIPTFEPNRLPGADRFYLYVPFPSVTNRNTERPDERIGDTELAMRVYRYIGSYDLSLYASRGFSRMPNMKADSMTSPTTVTSFYPGLSVYGASISGSALGGIGNIEGGYYDSRDDRGGTDPTIENSKWKFLAGYRKELGTDFTAGIQYYVERMDDYGEYEKNLPAGFPKEDKVRDYAALRLTKILLYQTMRFSFFGMYSPSDEDYLINSEASYKLTDELSVTGGGNIFGGKEDFTQFGQLDKNDNLYANLRYEF